MTEGLKVIVGPTSMRGAMASAFFPTRPGPRYTNVAMPIYEYRCQSCRKRTSVFVRSIGATVSARCEHCGGQRLSRLISRVAVVRSEDDAFGGLDESMLADVDENDPRSVARWARRMRSQMGEELGPDFDEAIEQMEAGQVPDADEAEGDWPLDED